MNAGRNKKNPTQRGKKKEWEGGGIPRWTEWKQIKRALIKHRCCKENKLQDLVFCKGIRGLVEKPSSPSSSLLLPLSQVTKQRRDLSPHFFLSLLGGQAGLCEMASCPGPRSQTACFYARPYLGTFRVFIFISHVGELKKKKFQIQIQSRTSTSFPSTKAPNRHAHIRQAIQV